MASNPLDTCDYEVPLAPLEVALALREMADGESDYLGRLLMVAAHHVEAFAGTREATDPTHLAEARRIATGPDSTTDP